MQDSWIKLENAPILLTIHACVGNVPTPTNSTLYAWLYATHFKYQETPLLHWILFLIFRQLAIIFKYIYYINIINIIIIQIESVGRNAIPWSCCSLLKPGILMLFSISWLKHLLISKFLLIIQVKLLIYFAFKTTRW